MYRILMLFALGICTSEGWLCGNEGQCRCTSSGEVVCNEIRAAPYFLVNNRQDKRLTMKTTGNFDLDTLADTSGFARVMLMGLSDLECSRVEQDFPWILCVADSAIYAVPLTKALTPFKRGTDPIATPRPMKYDHATQDDEDDDDDDEVVTFKTLNVMIAWAVISGIVGAICTACILVSLVNLHARINTHAGSNDPPIYAVYFCLRCIAVLLCPFHLCARCFSCTNCALYNLEEGFSTSSSSTSTTTL